ncbi:hypothetical protein F3D3_1914 [Fusibacter sp. 3D3]|nr:hypothetical protein F3D3_1914 [Fusibacter sp. 3D3]
MVSKTKVNEHKWSMLKSKCAPLFPVAHICYLVHWMGLISIKEA